MALFRLAAVCACFALGWPSTGAAQERSQEERPTLAVSGVLYAEYAYALRGQAGAGHSNNFDVTRAYLNFVGRFPEGVGSRVTGDVYRNADGSLGYRLKYGFVTYRPSGSALTFRLGQMDTPYVSYNEGLWDYRMQGSDPTDRAGYLKSSDFGAGIDGTWNDDQVTLSSGVFNGEFYNRTPGDQHKDVAARLSVRVARSDQDGRYGGLRLTGFALVGEPNGGGRRSRVLGGATYRSKQMILGVHFGVARDRVDSTATAPTTRGTLLSVMGVYRVPNSRVAFIGRYDNNDPDTARPDDRIETIIAGVSYQLSPNLRLLADLDHVVYQAPVSPAVDAERSQALFQVQLAF